MPFFACLVFAKVVKKKRKKADFLLHRQLAISLLFCLNNKIPPPPLFLSLFLWRKFLSSFFREIRVPPPHYCILPAVFSPPGWCICNWRELFRDTKKSGKHGIPSYSSRFDNLIWEIKFSPFHFPHPWRHMAKELTSKEEGMSCKWIA